MNCTIIVPGVRAHGSSGRTCALGAHTWRSVRVSVTGHVQWLHPSDPPKLAQHTVSDNLCERWVITRVTRTNSRKFSGPMLETFVAPLGLDEYHRPIVLPWSELKQQIDRSYFHSTGIADFSPNAGSRGDKNVAWQAPPPTHPALGLRYTAGECVCTGGNFCNGCVVFGSALGGLVSWGAILFCCAGGGRFGMSCSSR